MKLLYTWIVVCLVLAGLSAGWLLSALPQTSPRGSRASAARQSAAVPDDKDAWAAYSTTKQSMAPAGSPGVSSVSSISDNPGITSISGVSEIARVSDLTLGGAEFGGQPAPATRWAGDLRAKAQQDVAMAAERVLNAESADGAALRGVLDELLAGRQWALAERVLGRLIELEPADHELRLVRAGCLMQQARWRTAIDDLEPITAQQPEHVAAWFNLAVARQALGHLAAAHAAWDRVIEMESAHAKKPESAGAMEIDSAGAKGVDSAGVMEISVSMAERTRLAEAYARRAEVLLDLEDWPAAAADCEAALAHGADGAGLRLNLALALSRQERYEESRAILRSVLDEHPRHLLALNRFASVCLSLLDAGHDTGHDVNGDIGGNGGDGAGSKKDGDGHRRAAWREEARAACRLSLEIDPRQEDVREMLAQLANEKDSSRR